MISMENILNLERQLYDAKIKIASKYDILENIRIELDRLYRDDFAKYEEIKASLKDNTWDALENSWKLWDPSPNEKNGEGEWIGENKMTFRLNECSKHYNECLQRNFVQCTYDEHGGPNFDSVTFPGSIVDVTELYEDFSAEKIKKRGGCKNSLQERAQSIMSEQLSDVVRMWAQNKNKKYDSYVSFYEWRDENDLLPHEDTNCRTMRLVDRTIHDVFTHRGGVANVVNIKTHFNKTDDE